MTWTIRVLNWKDFQHYKDRDPPWIKLHQRRLFEKPAWRRLHGSAAKLLVDVWMLAAALGEKGELTMTLPDLAYRVRVPVSEVLADLQVLKAFDFLELAPVLLAEDTKRERPQASVVLETETERETEAEKSKSKTVPDGTAQVAYRTLLPLIRQHLWRPDGKCPDTVKGKPWSEAQECTVIRELRKAYSVRDIGIAIEGLGNMLRGLAEAERPDWLAVGSKASLRAIYHTRSGVVVMLEKCDRAYWSVANKRPKQPRGGQPARIELGDVA